MPEVKLSCDPSVEEDVILENTALGIYTQIKAHSVLNHVSFGDFSYCAGYNQIDYAQIGKFCSIASMVRINPGNHPTYTRAAQHHFTYRCEMFGLGQDDADFFAWRIEDAVTIGHDVWIGHGAVVMPGVTVGNGAVIGTGAVVTKDVEPYTVVAGVPAKKIKMRFAEEVIEKMELIQWWNWSYDTIKERLADFRDAQAFVDKFS